MLKKNQSLPKTYELAVEELQQTIAQIEAGQMPLDELLQRYERCSKLLQFCQQSLQAIEQQVKVIDDQLQGN